MACCGFCTVMAHAPGGRVIGPLLLAVSLLALRVEHLRFGARHLRERPALDVG